ncbi:MAG TPA: AraC family transcriptional regulator [Candidatus Polarisedimenticolaceae bacterium]|nr:AraC family transcriptional regulator [Candidatus Polarisedimenticolaceae bacterium]
MARLGTRVLFELDELQVVATHWHRDEHPSTSSAEAPMAIIELLEHGSFVKHRSREPECVDRNAIAYFNPGERFRIEHPLGADNAGLWIQIGAGWWETNAMEVDPELPFRRSTSASSFAADLMRRRLAKRLGDGPRADPLGVEEALHEVIAHALCAHEGASRSHLDRRRPSGRMTQRVAAARAFLAETFRRKLSLTDVASVVGGSSFALCRAFAALTGGSIHQHIVSLRLRAALDEIEDGCHDLTALALRCGFASHAHFTASFRAAYGRTPSGTRRESRA